MKRLMLLVTLGLLLIGFNAFAADGDLYVNGKVGIGTTSPINALDVRSVPSVNIISAVETTTNRGVWIGHDATKGIIRTSYVNTGGFTPLSFQTSNVDRIYIDTTGNVGIGTTNPGSKFQIRATNDNTSHFSVLNPSGTQVLLNMTTWANGSPAVYLYNPDGSALAGITNNGASFINWPFAVNGSATNGYSLYVNGTGYITAGGWAGSDIRWKKDIMPLENSLDQVLQLQGVSYDWRVDEFKDKHFDEGRQIGFIAQEVEKVIPELVKTDSEGYKAVSYEKMTAVLAEAIKEQQKEIEELKAEIAILKNKN